MYRLIKLMGMFALSTLLLFGCSTTTDKIIIEEIKQAMNEISYDNILHIEIVRNGVLVFYKDGETLNTSFIRKQTDDKWKFVSTGAAADIKPDKDVSLGVTVNPSISLFYSYGVILNPEIVKVIAVADNWETERTAKIVTTVSGERIWFSFFEQPIEPIFDVIGLLVLRQ